jgi:hypothetical protein
MPIRRAFVLAAAALTACNAAPQQEAAIVPPIALCAEGEQRRNLEGRISGTTLELRAECDTGGALRVHTLTLRLPAQSGGRPGDQRLLSLWDPSLAPRQVIEAPLEEGAPHRFLMSTARARCRPILATPTGDPPIPADFTDRYGRWTLTMGFLADAACRVVVAYSGNQAVLLSADSPARASLYNLTLVLGDR